MRADRLIALLLLLQRKGTITAAEAAEELEVSLRTARRDLEALAMSGVPIYSTPGRGGGWRLLGSARTDLSGLSSNEARALFLAAGPALGSSPELKLALQKLSHALPATFQADAEAASAAIKVDPSGWGHISAETTPFHDELITAVVDGHQVKISYESPRSGDSTRLISPLGLVTKRNTWYVVANTANGIRTFRLSRIRTLDATAEPVDRPPDFDLEAAWEQIVTTVEARRGDVVVQVVASPEVANFLRFQFSGRIDFDEQLRDDGQVSATIAEFGVRPLIGQLAGHGSAVEIVDPSPEIEQEFTRLTAELADRWL